MDKYNLISIINAILGVSQIIIALIYLFSIIPNASSSLIEFGTKLELPIYVNFLLWSVIGMGLINLIIAYLMIIRDKKSKDRLYTINLIIALTTFLLSGIIYGSISNLITSAIYNVANNF